MNEENQHIFMLVTGYEYEGSGVRSIHRTERGAQIAAEDYMKDNKCYSEERWTEEEPYAYFIAARWNCGDHYVEIRKMELQE